MKENYLFNEQSDISMLESELSEQMTMTHSVLNALYLEFMEHIKQPEKQQLLVLLFKQMKEVQVLHSALYEKNANMPEQGLFVLNPQAKSDDLRIEFMELIYTLNSICLITYDVLLDEINDHLLNTLSALMRATRKIVRIAEEINLRAQTFKGLPEFTS
ncbi:MAG: hypothetical protein K2Q14_05890 [Gammaproteobacteria bacterium]|nr:hypothetical protein [Gammaproteobacteria bacterium]